MTFGNGNDIGPGTGDSTNRRPASAQRLPDSWSSLYELGLARIRSGACATLVEEVFLRAYACEPSRTEPLMELAKFSRRQGRYDDAFRFAEQLVNKLPSDSGNDGAEARDALGEFVESAWRSGKLKSSLLAMNRLLDNPTLDASERIGIERIRTMVLRRLASVALRDAGRGDFDPEKMNEASVGDGLAPSETGATLTSGESARVSRVEEPLVHIPLYCAHDASVHAMRYMVELHISCLESYFSHENDNDVLVTTNDERVLEVFSQIRRVKDYRFELRLVGRNEMLSAFRTDETRLMDIPCTRMLFSKFFPILSGMSNAIVHLDYDTILVSKVDFRELLASDIALVNANQFSRDSGRWFPSRAQASYFGIDQSKAPVCNWLNSGVFSVRQNGIDTCRAALEDYLRNLERAIDDGIHDYPDELILNALAVRDPEAVAIIPDYRYNFLAYYLKHDPTWTWRGKIVHFHSVKPNAFRCVGGRVEQRYDAWHPEELDENFYLAALLWFRHLHAACHKLAMDLPMLKALPAEVVHRELRRIAAERSADMLEIV